MSSKRVFTGVPFTPKPKCVVCEHFEQCRNSDNSLTIRIMVLECESFYYLFKQLEKFEKLPTLSENEDKNLETIDNYIKRHEGIPTLTSPFVVNGALAVELALKFLIFKEKGSYECIHNLQRLFEQLPDCHKDALAEIICEHFRYSFGKEHLGYTNFFNEFVHIVCDYAIMLKPIDEEEIEDG